MATIEQDFAPAEPGLSQRLRRVFFGRTATIIATITVVIFIFVAAFAPWIAPMTRWRKASSRSTSRRPGIIGWAQTSSGGTCCHG
ncbi:hypothetical protein ACFSYD_21145 [Paracoccus aerius]